MDDPYIKSYIENILIDRFITDSEARDILNIFLSSQDNIDNLINNRYTGIYHDTPSQDNHNNHNITK